MLTLLTATGERPAQWALCQRWMAAQTYAGPVRWIIVDDGREPQPVTFAREGWTLEVIRPRPYWRPGDNTQARNLQAGLALVERDAVLAIIEDDDWYGPGWLSAVMANADRAHVIGTPRARYWHAGARIAREHRNERHSSLCSTAVSGPAIDVLRRVAKPRTRYIDRELWAHAPSAHLFAEHHVVGIKGLPGRAGIGAGHEAQPKGTPDPDVAILRSWVGDAAEAYL